MLSAFSNNIIILLVHSYNEFTYLLGSSSVVFTNIENHRGNSQKLQSPDLVNCAFLFVQLSFPVWSISGVPVFKITAVPPYLPITLTCTCWHCSVYIVSRLHLRNLSCPVFTKQLWLELASFIAKMVLCNFAPLVGLTWLVFLGQTQGSNCVCVHYRVLLYNVLILYHLTCWCGWAVTLCEFQVSG